MLADHTDAQVAAILNDRSVKTGANAAFSSAAVQWVRFNHDLKSLKQNLEADGWLPTARYAAKLGVHCGTLKTWLKKGLIQGQICNDAGDWMFEPHQKVPSRSKPGRKPRPKSAGPEIPIAKAAGGAV